MAEADVGRLEQDVAEIKQAVFEMDKRMSERIGGSRSTRRQ